MKNVAFDAEVIAETAWTGVYAVVPENEDSFYLPHIEGENPLWLLLNIDETAIWMRPDGLTS